MVYSIEDIVISNKYNLQLSVYGSRIEDIVITNGCFHYKLGLSHVYQRQRKYEK